MNDCPNAEIRDQLPDLLNERLTVSARAAVIAHVDGCVDCREELELLRGVRAVLVALAPRIDITHVVRALPKPPVSNAVRPLRSRSTWVDWRVAAAVTLLVVGGSSVAVMNRGPSVADSVAIAAASQTLNDSPSREASTTDAIADARSRGATEGTLPGSATSEETVAAAGLGMAGHLADLDDSQLQALLDEIDQMKAVPITEPEPVAIRIEPTGAEPNPESSLDVSPEGR